MGFPTKSLPRIDLCQNSIFLAQRIMPFEAELQKLHWGGITYVSGGGKTSDVVVLRRLIR
jgi:hypothetical protein